MFNSVSQVGRKSNVAYYLSKVSQLSVQISLVNSELGAHIAAGELNPAGMRSRDSYLRKKKLELQSKRQVVCDELVLCS